MVAKGFTSDNTRQIFLRIYLNENSTLIVIGLATPLMTCATYLLIMHPYYPPPHTTPSHPHPTAPRSPVTWRLPSLRTPRLVGQPVAVCVYTLYTRNRFCQLVCSSNISPDHISRLVASAAPSATGAGWNQSVALVVEQLRGVTRPRMWLCTE